MKKLLFTLLLTGIATFAMSQTKTYHGLGANVGFSLDGNTGQKVVIQPEYEINVLNTSGNFTHGFVAGVGVGIPTASGQSIFLTAKGGYKLDAFAAGLILHFTSAETLPGAWVNANVSESIKIQVSFSKHSYTTVGLLYFPGFMNKR